MANMSYCRYQNTASDLSDCLHHIEEVEDLSRDELVARRRIIDMVREIASAYEEEYGDEEVFKKEKTK